MTAPKLTPPPPTQSSLLDRWLNLLWRVLTADGQIRWSVIDTTGSNLTDIETRNHADLQNINTASYHHLTQTNHDDLTDGGNTTLHFHAADRDRANHTGTQLSTTISDFMEASQDAVGGALVDTASINFTYTDASNQITADVLPAGVDHAALGNLNSASYTHLTATNHTDLTDGGITTLHRHNASDVELERIGASTYSTVQHLQNIFHSAGWVSGGVVTDNGNGSVAVSGGNGTIRIADSETATIKFFDFAAVNPLSLTNSAQNWVYIDYNAGSPVITASTTEPSEHHTKIKLATIYRNGTELHINQTVRYEIGDHAANMIQQLQETMPYARVSGAVISETGTRKLAVTAGVFWHGLSRFTTAALNTNVSGSFSTFYGSGPFTEVTAQTTIDNTQYDNAGVLTALSANRYTNRWVYLATDGDVHVVYGRAQYVQLGDCQDESPPANIAPELNTDSFLIGRFIVRQGSTNTIQTDSAFDVEFTTASVSNHANLSGLQGGTAGEYYHLTAAEYAALGTGSGTVSNIISTPTTIATDTSYIVVGYLTVTSDFTINGNVGVF